MSEERDYLRKELEETQRSFRTGVWAMAVLSVLILGYFQWLRVQLAEILLPQNIAEVMVSEVRRSLPGARDALKENLRKAAPEVVAFVTEQVTDEAIPMVRESAEAVFREYARELAGFGREAVVKVFSEVIRDHKAELARKGQHHTGALTGLLNQREAARRSGKAVEEGAYVEVSGEEIDTGAIAKRLSKYVSSELGSRLNDVPEETLRQKLDESMKALRNINDQLKRLARKRDISREDQMGKRLITTWWTFLNRGDLPETTEEAMLNNVPLPVTEESLPE